MPLPNLSVPQYPDVPLAPGVPPVLRNPAAPPVAATTRATTTHESADANVPQWGVYDQNSNLVVAFDTVIGVAYRNESKISDYPQEQGSFGSYNKVQVPYDARVRFAKSGAVTDRTQFLSDMDSAAKSLDLYLIITPEIIYQNANIVHYDYSREQKRGANMIVVDVWLREVRITGQTSYSNTKTPAGADAVNQGSVQATTPTGQQAAAAAGPQR